MWWLTDPHGYRALCKLPFTAALHRHLYAVNLPAEDKFVLQEADFHGTKGSAAPVEALPAAVGGGQNLQGLPSFPGSVTEIQPDGSPQPAVAVAARGQESGIAEVLDDRAARLKYRISPLSTLSR